MKKVLEIFLGVLTAIGGFVDIGDIVANAEAGVGLIIQGNSCLYDEGRTSPGMTIVSTRERMLRLAPMVDAVHRAGASIWIQVGLGGLFAMEAWHEPYATQRQRPLLAASKPPLALRPVYRRAPIHVMAADDIRAMAVQYGEAAALAIVSLGPSIALGVLAQKHLVRGLTLGAVRG